jgi:sugar lactone lactonase YvrE
MTPNSSFLNGVIAIPGVSDAVLVSDSILGVVGRLDISTGIFDTSAFAFPEMTPIPGGSFGINGIKLHDGYLYWTNSNAATIYRVAITSKGFLVKGAKPQVVSNLSKSVSFLDDFAFSSDGYIYATSNFDNSVVRIDTKTGKWKTVVGGIHDMTVAGSTAVAFGNGKLGQKKMFVSTSGALAMPVDGTKTEGAKVVAVDL